MYICLHRRIFFTVKRFNSFKHIHLLKKKVSVAAISKSASKRVFYTYFSLAQMTSYGLDE